MIPLMAISAGLAGVGAIGKIFSGGKQAEKYKNMIANYDRQTLDNAGENISLNPYVSNMMLDNVSSQQAGMVDALAQGGGRNLIGGIGKVGQIGVQASQQALADLNQQSQRREYAIFSDSQRIRQMQEQRERQDLAGMGAMYEAGKQTMWGGLGDLAQTGMYAARGLEFGGGGSPEQIAGAQAQYSGDVITENRDGIVSNFTANGSQIGNTMDYNYMNRETLQDQYARNFSSNSGFYSQAQNNNFNPFYSGMFRQYNPNTKTY